MMYTNWYFLPMAAGPWSRVLPCLLYRPTYCSKMTCVCFFYAFTMLCLCFVYASSMLFLCCSPALPQELLRMCNSSSRGLISSWLIALPGENTDPKTSNSLHPAHTSGEPSTLTPSFPVWYDFKAHNTKRAIYLCSTEKFTFARCCITD